MRKNSAVILGTIATLAILSSSPATAGIKLLGTTTDPTGIDGVVVDGVNYDVTFSTTTLNSLFKGNSSIGVDAANALSADLVKLGVTELGNASPSGEYLIDVENTLSIFNGAVCDNIPCDSAQLWHAGAGFGSPGLGFVADGYAYVEAADFVQARAAPIPEPATWAMLMLGFGAIGWTLRSKRQIAVA
jgi:hypothetical protein